MAEPTQPGILLIADDYDEATQAERVLRKYRISNRVERARDCDEAMKLLKAGFSADLQLALLDHSAPGMPALEAIVRMRGLPGLEEMPVIVFCGNPEEERAVKGWNMKRVAGMSKPVGFFKLLECIQRLEMHWFVFGSKPA